MNDSDDESMFVLIPEQVREELMVQPGDPVEIWAEDAILVIRKPDPSCVFCGNSSVAVELNDQLVCLDCLTELQEISRFLIKSRNKYKKP